VATTSQQQVNSQSVYQPSQLATGSQWSTDASAAAGVSMTLQQKVYHLTPIEFEHPVIRQLPAYIDMCDPRWSTDPRIQPSIRPTAIAPVSEHSFYSPILANGESSLFIFQFFILVSLVLVSIELLLYIRLLCACAWFIK